MKIQLEESKFIIRLAGVSVGIHKYSITCDGSFFETSPIENIKDASIKIEIEMEKRERMAIFSFQFSGTLTAQCDRCLEDVTIPIDFSTQLVVNFTTANEFLCDDDQVWAVWEKAHEIDMYQYIYDAIILSLPVQFIHPEDENGVPTCNPEMLETLAQYLIDEEDLENPTNDIETIDPRWEKLKNINL